MKEAGKYMEPVLVVGSNKLAYSLVVCLRDAGHPVILSTGNAPKAWNYLRYHKNDIRKWAPGQYGPFNIKVIEDLHFENGIKLAFIITEEDLTVKNDVIRILESRLSEDTIIAVNSETISLDLLQEKTLKPERILVANWVEPVNTTFFLEIVANQITSGSYVDHLCDMARTYWGKDPYVINGDTGVRMRLLAALMREAFYLVDNGYATVEDIDRACRNDAGYYLPFAGNLRYMDLMGTYSYGMVMKDLNPELAKDRTAPDFFTTLIGEGDFGMESGKGFYAYQPGEDEKWEALVKKFSTEIHEVIEKYPFNQKTD